MNNDNNDHDTQNTPRFGLPGKNIKQDPPHARRLKPAIALGISLLDTNVADRTAPTRPKQAPPTDQPVRSSQETSYITIAVDRDLPPSLHAPGSAGSYQQQLSPASSRAPAIVLTPTDHLTDHLTDRRTIYPAGRPPSSVYIQPVPKFAKSSWLRRAEAHALAASARPTTYIEDDGQTDLASSVKSPFNPPTPTRPTSVDTVLPTPRRSIGWWNVFLSPIIARVSTPRSFRFSPISPDDAPEMPVLGRAMSIDGAAPNTNETRNSAAAMSTFYMIPTVGEAAPYYDHLQDFSTPKVQNAGRDQFEAARAGDDVDSPGTEFSLDSTPSPRPHSRSSSGNSLTRGDSKRTLDSESSQHEVGNSPEPDSIQTDVPRPLFLDTKRALTAQTVAGDKVPQSARAEICHAPEADLLSPKSPSPVIGVASAGVFGSARQVQCPCPSPAPSPDAKPDTQPDHAAAAAAIDQTSAAAPVERSVVAPDEAPVAAPVEKSFAPFDARPVDRSAAMAHQSTLDKLTARPPLPPPPVYQYLAREPSPFRSPFQSRPASVLSTRSTDHLAPMPPAKDSAAAHTNSARHLSFSSVASSSAPQEKSKGPPGLLSRMLDNQYKSPPRAIHEPREKQPGLLSKVFPDGLPHYTSPPHMPASGRPQSRWRRHFCLLALVGVFIFALLIILLALFLPQRYDDMPVALHWVRTSQFPPLPTGIATVAEPTLASSRTTCVKPNGLWSCAVPQGSQPTASTGSTPNFRLEIRFRNGTSSTASSSGKVRRAYSGAATASATIKAKRGYFSSLIYATSPAPPAVDEMAFLGQTTDNVTGPNFAGEETPFYVSFLPTDATPAAASQSATPTAASTPTASTTSDQPQLRWKRQAAPASNDTSDLPPPALAANGSASLGELYPFPAAQPLRLFDRGLDTEHYGFYTYFDRTMLVKLPSAIAATTATATDVESADIGASIGEANAVCTFSQTRFFVQMWTRPQASTLPSVNATLSNASASDWTRPGSFPYHVTLTLDRHGGDGTRKGVYCYGVDTAGNVQLDAKALMAESRTDGGTLLSPADGAFRGPLHKDATGVDGGTGGCSCSWQNWS